MRAIFPHFYDSVSKVEYQPRKLVAAGGIAVIKAVLCGIYDGKKIAVVRFPMSVVFIFTTCIIVVISERLISLLCIA